MSLRAAFFGEKGAASRRGKGVAGGCAHPQAPSFGKAEELRQKRKAKGRKRKGKMA